MIAGKAKPIIIAGGLLAWFGVIVQLYIMLNNAVNPIPETIFRFFSFFTILTNTLVAIAYTSLWLTPSSKAGAYFSRGTVLTAIAVYIIVVGAIYNTILRFNWDPQGLQKLVDEVLHTIDPILFLIFWWIYAPKGGLKRTNIPVWLVYPFLYCVYILVTGPFTGFYPYPFMNVDQLGYAHVLMNSVVVCVVFLVLCFVFVAVGKRRAS